MAGIAIVVVALVCVVGSSASAQERRGGMPACKEDVKALCGDVKPGGGRILRCLHAKEAQVSPGCRDELAQRRAEAREKAQACRGDVKRLCAGIRPGQGRIAACLKSNEANLSPGCKAEMPKE